MRRSRAPRKAPHYHVDRLDQATVARARVQAIDRHCRIARMADQAMPMAVWYRQPKGGFYCVVVEGWAA